jgi:GT2 family glycosyltransferase
MRAAWLCDGVLIALLGEGALADEATGLAGPANLEARYLPLEAGGEPSGIVLVRLLEGEDADAVGEVTLRSDESELTIGMKQTGHTIVDLRALVREDLAGLDADSRTELISFLADGLSAELATPRGEQVAQRLYQLRDVLRERLPYRIISRQEPLSLAIDSVLAVDDSSFWLMGWLWNRHAALEPDTSPPSSNSAPAEGDDSSMKLSLVSPEGSRIDGLADAFRWRRPDIDEIYRGVGVEQPFRSGFINYVEIPTRSLLPTGWVGELRTAGGGGCEAKAPEVVRGLEKVREGILENVDLVPKYSHELMLNHAFPAISRVQERLKDMVEVKTAVQLGTPPRDPRASVIVPLYRRIDFLEHQLAQFARDATMADADLIYVLDSPEHEDRLLRMAASLYDMYRLPLRVIVLNRNAGYSQANNMGALAARAPLLLLLNSDVLPDRPGWLGVMADFYESTPGIGALGPKLLFEDDSLQHAGMYFRDITSTPEGVYFIGEDMRHQVWQNAHYYKGLPRALPAANTARPVPAVTGACMMVARELYEDLGGLCTLYVKGGYEDSDFCLRLSEHGRTNWYLPEAELYHLEAQSFSSELRDVATRYNMALQAHLRGDAVRGLDEPRVTKIESY